MTTRARWRAPLGAVAALTALFATVSLRRHAELRSGGYDLGIFGQVARDWSELRVPTVHLVGDARLAADHFSPALALLGLPYAAVPHVEVLLVVQAVLLASGVVPLMRWAGDLWGLRGALLVAVVYGLSPGLTGTAWWDFHEVALAVPLVSCAVVALGRDRLVAAAAWSAPLVLVKEDLGVTVAVVGGFIAVKGARRLGAALAVWGLGWSALAVLVVLPAISRGDGYFYTDTLLSGGVGGVLTTLVSSPGTKLAMLLALLLPTLFIALRSPLVLLALPTLGWRLALDVEFFHLPSTQYDAVLVPVMTAAFVDGLRRLGPLRLRTAVAAATVTTLLSCLLHLSPLFQASFWQTSDRVVAARALADRVPDGATVAATNQLVPRLVDRTEVYLFGDYPPDVKTIQPSDWRRAEWILVDTGATSRYRRLLSRQLDEQLASAYVLVARSHGVTLARRADVP